MNDCEAMQARFSEYLDGRLNGREMQQISAHVSECRDCDREWDSLRQVQQSLSALGPVPQTSLTASVATQPASTPPGSI